MLRTTRLGTLLIILAVPSMAAAEERTTKFTEITLAGFFGGFDLGDVSGLSVGGHIDVARRWNDWALIGEWGIYGIGEDPTYDMTMPEARRGSMQRVAVGLRRYVQFSDAKLFETNGWIEAGLGLQMIDIAWEGDRELERRDLHFGFGMEWGGRDLKKLKLKSLGMFYALRVNVARTPESMLPDAGRCGGPCTDSGGGQPYDFGIYLNWGLTFGL